MLRSLLLWNDLTDLFPHCTYDGMCYSSTVPVLAECSLVAEGFFKQPHALDHLPFPDFHAAKLYNSVAAILLLSCESYGSTHYERVTYNNGRKVRS